MHNVHVEMCDAEDEAQAQVERGIDLCRAIGYGARAWHGGHGTSTEA